MNIDIAYTRLIETGCTVETAKRLSESVSKMSANTFDAFIIWASGHSIRESAKLCGISHVALLKAIKKCKKESGYRDMYVSMGNSE